MARKRQFTAFNLSFLDVMSCGFGAVVLVFLIIDHGIEQETRRVNIDLVSEANLLEEDIRDGKENMVRLRNILSDTDLQMVEARGLASRITEDIEDFQAMIESLELEGFSDRSEEEILRAEIQKLEAEVEKLRASSQDDGGNSARTFVGEGNRQYLTGLNLGGRNILILLDASASMLAPELVNIIRLRNMSDDIRRSADKWKRTVATVEWLSAQLPVNAKYQIYSYNTSAAPLLTGTEGSWLSVSDEGRLEENIDALRRLVPGGGTSLENAILAMLDLDPLPDNVFLITDGLPTQGAAAPRASKVTQQERIRLFENAIRQLPRSVPVNVILAPMEGEPAASSLYWKLAISSRGSFLSPSRDWP